MRCLTNCLRALAVTALLLAALTACQSGDTNGTRQGNSDTNNGDNTVMMTDAKRSELIPPGQKAPLFTAMDQTGRTVALEELLRSGPVVLVFYPANNTPVCTKQLCAVRDDWSRFQDYKATVLGINPADQKSHAAFAGKHEFPFPVLSDDDSRIARSYGASGLLMTRRSVYVVGQDGIVLLAEHGVVPHEKIFEVLQAL